MNAFIEKHRKHSIGVLRGWDRIVFRGTLRLVANLAGMYVYLSRRGILMKDFKAYAQGQTAALIEASVAKAGSILRTECTINNHRAFTVYRRSERDPKGPKRRLPMSKGVADLYARSEIPDQINDRYLEALATLDTTERVETVVVPICRRRTSGGKSIRALRPWSESDRQLLAAVSACGLAGDFRNRDLAARLYPKHSAQEASAKVTYLLRLLREHRIVRRLPHTRKYRLTPHGARIIATILLTQNATTEQLNKAAA